MTDTHPTMHEYPFPLRPDCTVTLWLPKDLTPREVLKLVRYMEALVLEPEPPFLCLMCGDYHGDTGLPCPKMAPTS